MTGLEKYKAALLKYTISLETQGLSQEQKIRSISEWKSANPEPQVEVAKVKEVAKTNGVVEIDASVAPGKVSASGGGTSPSQNDVDIMEGVDELIPEVKVAGPVPADIYKVPKDPHGTWTSIANSVAGTGNRDEIIYDDLQIAAAKDAGAVLYDKTMGDLGGLARLNPEIDYMVFGEASSEGYPESVHALTTLNRRVSSLKNKQKDPGRYGKMSNRELTELKKSNNQLNTGYDAHMDKYGTVSENVIFRSPSDLADKRYRSSGNNIKRELIAESNEDTVKDDVLSYGFTVLGEDSKEVVELKEKLKTEYIEGSEEYKDAEARIKELTNDVEKLYNPATGRFYARNNDIPAAEEFDRKVEEVAGGTDIENLKTKAVELYAQLVGGIKDLAIITKDFVPSKGMTGGIFSPDNPDWRATDSNEVTVDENTRRAIEKYSSVMDYVKNNNKLPVNISDLGGLFDSDKDFIQDALDFGQSIATYNENDRIYGTSGTSRHGRGFSEYSPVLAEKFNETLAEYLIVNKAIQTNTNPLSNKDVKVWEELKDAVKNIIGHDETTLVEEKQVFLQTLEEMGVPEEDLTKFKTDRTLLQDTARFFPELVQFVAEIEGVRRGSNYAVRGLGAKAIQAMTWLARGNKPLIAASKFVVPALVEGGEFASVTALKNTFTSGEKESVGDSFGMGVAFGIGGGLVRPILGGVLGAFAKSGAAPKVFNSKFLQHLDKSRFLRTQVKQATGAVVGGSTFVAGNILMDPLDYDYSNLLYSTVLETNKMFLLTKLKRGFPGMRDSYRELSSDILRMNRLNPGAVKGAKILGVGTDIIKNPTEDSNSIIEKAAEEKNKEIQDKLDRNEITPKQANDARVNVGIAHHAIASTIGANQAKAIIEQQKKDGQILTEGEMYELGKVVGKGGKLTQKQADQITHMSPESLLYYAGMEINDANLIASNSYIDNNVRIKAMLGGESTYMSSKGFERTGVIPHEYKATTPKSKREAYKFLQDQSEANNLLESTKNTDKTGLSPLQLVELDKQLEFAQENFDKYIEGGEEYKKIQEILSGAAALEYSKSVNKQNLLEGDGKGGKFIHIKDPEEFAKKLIEIDGESEVDGTKVLGITDPATGNRYSNTTQALAVRDVSVIPHEDAHFVVMDVLKDAKGNVTPEGIVFIDELLEKISPKEREAIRLNIASRYDAREDNKEEWYEENLTVLSEFINEKKINFKLADKKSFVEVLKGLLDPLQKKHFKNLDTSNPEGMFEMLRGLAEGKPAAVDRANEFSREAAIAKGETLTTEGKSVKSESIKHPEEEKYNTFSPEQKVDLAAKITKAKSRKEQGIALAIKHDMFKKNAVGDFMLDKKGNKIPDPPYDAVLNRIETGIFAEIATVVDKVVTAQTKALHDPIAKDAKKNVTREHFKGTMRNDINLMVIDEYKNKQPLEKFIVSRGYLRSYSLAEKLGVPSVEQGINKGIEAADNIITVEETTSDAPRKEVITRKVDPFRVADSEVITEVSKIKDRMTWLESNDPKAFTEAAKIDKHIRSLKEDKKKSPIDSHADIDREIDKKNVELEKVVKESVAKSLLKESKDEWVTAVEANMAKHGITDVKELTYKQIGLVTPYEILANKFGLNAKQIYDPKSNLSGNVSEIQRWINNDAVALKNLLPLSNVEIEKVAAIGKIRATTTGGESTGLSRNIIKNFYEPKLNENGEHVKKRNSLQYALKPNVSLAEFKAAFGIGKDGNDKGAKTEQAQTIKGLLEIVSRNMTNHAVRRLEDRKEAAGEQDPGTTAVNKDILFKGTSPVMLSNIIRQHGIEQLGNGALNDILEDAIKVFKRGGSLTTNVAYLDVPRKKYQNYVKDNYQELVHSNEYINEAIIKASAKDPKLKELLDDVKRSHDRYLTRKITEANQEVATKFEKSGNRDFNTFLNNIVKGSATDINAAFGIRGEVSLSKLTDSQMGSLKMGVEKLLVDYISELGEKEGLRKFIKTWQPGLASGTNYSPYGTNSKLFDLVNSIENSVVKNAIKNGIFETKKVAGGNTIMVDGIKVTKTISQETNAYDLYDFLNGLRSDVDIKNRTKQSIESGKLFIDAVETLKKGLEEGTISSDAAAILLRSMGTSMRGVAKTLAKLRYFYPVEGLKPSQYTFEHGIPTQQLLAAAAYYINNGGATRKNINNIIDKSFVTILPTKLGNIVNSFFKDKFPYDNALSLRNPGVTRYDNILVKEYYPEFDIKNMVDLRKLPKKQTTKTGRVKTPLSLSPKKRAEDYKAKVPKKIRIFDFDDTLARTKSKIIYKMPDGTKGKINPAEFAREAVRMEAEGAKWDFSEFSKVMDGKKGPLFKVAQIIADKRGTKDVFVLTARPQDAAGPIKEFLESMGLNIPLKNITGLGDGSSKAKADWMIPKIAEGYNDFYFADDHTGNVKAVKELLSTFDVKGKVQLAKVRYSKEIKFDKLFNKIIESSTDIKDYREFSAARAKTIGSSKGRFKFFIPPSAEDFTGLLYQTLGKGKVGDAQMAFYKESLLDPYNRAEMATTQAKINAAKVFKALKSDIKTLPKSLAKPTGIGGFTYSHAIRVAIWTAQGMEIPGLSERDVKELNTFVDNDPRLKRFAEELIDIQEGRSYPPPYKEWVAGTITSDVINGINKVNRKEYLEEWQENVDIIFSEKNINKLEAAYGPRYVEALKDSLRAMKSGSNRPIGGNRITTRVLDWLNNSVGVIMFLNTKSAALQLLSVVNFVNHSDNNIVAAGKAFANQKQFWKDFSKLMDSPYLVERREGLKINVSESEIADAVAESKDKVRAAISYMLNKGFLMTRIADSFAIASGGATFYRNRINSLVKSGMEIEDAEKQAMEDFYATAETSQQSSNASKISQQQRSTTGRVILAFGNTAMQYARIQKRAIQDLANGRGDAKTHISKILYYGVIQNFVFTALQQALFVGLFNDDDELDKDGKKKKKKGSDNTAIKTANTMLDNILRGLGIGGAVVSTVKNAIIKVAEESGKKSPDYTKAVDDLFGIAPPLQAKYRNMSSAARSFSWNREEMKEMGWDIDNPAYLATSQIIASGFNIPLDRALKKVNNIRNITSENSENWQKAALAIGYSTWSVGLPYYGVEGPPTPESLSLKRENSLKDLSKLEQVNILKESGMSKADIKALQYEKNRVEAIIKFQDDKKDPKKVESKEVVAEKVLVKRREVIKDMNKPEQVDILTEAGLTKKEIKALKYEKDRIEAIIKIRNKKKTVEQKLREQNK